MLPLASVVSAGCAHDGRSLGTIGAPAAIANAVADAVKPLGLTVTTLPIDPESLVRRGGD